ncbi:MAG TPA: PhzF family phenazine biosynthesis isomerase [Steroidobacteraceae bacterium]|nr:PhzF family phenazine biosynthesis isomerase [Steroidobacteraceae bacterium]
MDSVRLFQVDAFTARRFTGNPAGVLLDADALSLPQMRAIARELGAADCACVLRPDGADHDVRVRFLTPRGEAAFIGHATLAVHAVLATLGEPPRPRQKQQNGRVQVQVLAGGALPRIAIHLPAPQLLGAPDARVLPPLLAALSLTAADLDPRCPPRLAGVSGTRLLLGVTDGAVLARVRADGARLAQLSPQIGAPGVFLFTLRPAVAGVHTEARMFCPALGIPEDPVSGNAHGLLGVYLLEHGLLDAGRFPPAAAPPAPPLEFSGAQGHHIDRPGTVTVVLHRAGAAVQSISIIGEAVIAFAASVCP